MSTSIDTLIDMLSLKPTVASTLRSNGFKTVDDLVASTEWKQLISDKRSRSTIEGYLLVRKTNSARGSDESTRRAEAYSDARKILSELRELQLKKAMLERGTSATTRSADLQNKIANVLDEIDDCKERLKSTEQVISELKPNQQQTSKHPNVPPVRRPTKKSGMRSPRLMNEPVSRKPEVRTTLPGWAQDVNFEAKQTRRPEPSHCENTRPKTAWNASVPKPKMQSGNRPMSGACPQRKPQLRFPGKELSVVGSSASQVSLGINMEGDHYSQMMCGAVFGR